MKTLGVIAGNGKFPFLVAEEARRKGYRVAACAIVNETDPRLEQKVDTCLWVKIGQIAKLVKFFKSENISQALMAGKIEKVKLFQENVQPDFEMMKLIMKIRDFKDDSLLGAVADYLEGQGIEVLDSTLFLQDLLPGEGFLGKKKPSKSVSEDIAFGFQTAKALAAWDVGQTAVVKNKAVIALEAIEGTDEAIRRGGLLGAGQVTAVKVAKPHQDMRFDVPAVGLQTLEALKGARAVAFGFEAKKTIFLDGKAFIEGADKAGIVIMGITDSI